jgi:hypothetical protein
MPIRITKIKPVTRTLVNIIESERGWGSKVDEVLEFTGKNSREQAVRYCEEFNKQNTATVAPDWYMVAQLGATYTVTPVLK